MLPWCIAPVILCHGSPDAIYRHPAIALNKSMWYLCKKKTFLSLNFFSLFFHRSSPFYNRNWFHEKKFSNSTSKCVFGPPPSEPAKSPSPLISSDKSVSISFKLWLISLIKYGYPGLWYLKMTVLTWELQDWSSFKLDRRQKLM